MTSVPLQTHRIALGLKIVSKIEIVPHNLFTISQLGVKIWNIKVMYWQQGITQKIEEDSCFYWHWNQALALLQVTQHPSALPWQSILLDILSKVIFRISMESREASFSRKEQTLLFPSPRFKQCQLKISGSRTGKNLQDPRVSYMEPWSELSLDSSLWWIRDQISLRGKGSISWETVKGQTNITVKE